MRGVALGCLAATAALALVGGATALSTRAPEPFDQPLTLAGGPDAPGADPDAPIATARYGGERRALAAETMSVPAAATVALAGGPDEVGLAGGTSARSTAFVERQAARIEPARPAARLLTEAPPARRAPLALAGAPSRRPAEKILKARIDDQPLAFTPIGAQPSAVKRLTLNASRLVSRASTSPEDRRRGRWMLFAASSGKAYGLNLVRDAIGGWRSAGLSEEKLARFGSRQVGMGYRKDNRQISLTATRRKFRGIEYSDKDTVVGVTVSVRGR